LKTWKCFSLPSNEWFLDKFTHCSNNRCYIRTCVCHTIYQTSHCILPLSFLYKLSFCQFWIQFYESNNLLNVFKIKIFKECFNVTHMIQNHCLFGFVSNDLIGKIIFKSFMLKFDTKLYFMCFKILSNHIMQNAINI
jgi:hypothetical protein